LCYWECSSWYLDCSMLMVKDYDASKQGEPHIQQHSHIQQQLAALNSTMSNPTVHCHIQQHTFTLNSSSIQQHTVASNSTLSHPTAHCHIQHRTVKTSSALSHPAAPCDIQQRNVTSNSTWSHPAPHWHIQQQTVISQTNLILYRFFWVFPRCQYVVCRRFGTMCQFHLQRLGVDCGV
jgi:hypothetical protein